jgi:hypothetical protein
MSDDIDDRVLDHDRDLEELDDRADREELRQRYYGLMQELRVALPGVQVLLAFLLTAPFSDRFATLDDAGRAGFAVALGAAMTSVTCLVAPTVFHRVAARTDRVLRLSWSVRLALAGILFMAVALVAALWCIVRFVFGTVPAVIGTAAAVVLVTSLWIVIPLSSRRR